MTFLGSPVPFFDTCLPFPATPRYEGEVASQGRERMAAAEAVGTDPVPENELIERVARGDEDAFRVLYERYFPRVYSFLRRRLPNRADVEETTQEVFINVFSSLPSYRGEAPFAAWVLGVTRRTLANRFKRKRHAMVPLDDHEEPESLDVGPVVRQREPSPLEHYECGERLARLEQDAMRLLTAEQRQLFELHHLRHRSIQEIAHSLRKSEDAVKSHLYRARRVLLAR
jgi:RNA polymerase sigma-70 factor (ECF subfamily)